MDVFGGTADQNLDRARFHHETHVAVVERQLTDGEFETHRLLLPGRQGDALESLELLHRPGHAGHHIVHVQLNDFVTAAFADVRHVDAN